jgi:hypothetical protein
MAPRLDDLHARLERTLIDEFLESRGYNRESLAGLSADAARALLRAASEHASLKLAEVEARAHYVEEVHGRE